MHTLLIAFDSKELMNDFIAQMSDGGLEQVYMDSLAMNQPEDYNRNAITGCSFDYSGPVVERLVRVFKVNEAINCVGYTDEDEEETEEDEEDDDTEDEWDREVREWAEEKAAWGIKPAGGLTGAGEAL
jgi:Ran GTPase-activating protein (RanGAP) involved in mRNA processing and transport